MAPVGKYALLCAAEGQGMPTMEGRAALLVEVQNMFCAAELGSDCTVKHDLTCDA